MPLYRQINEISISKIKVMGLIKIKKYEFCFYFLRDLMILKLNEVFIDGLKCILTKIIYGVNELVFCRISSISTTILKFMQRRQSINFFFKYSWNSSSKAKIIKGNVCMAVHEEDQNPAVINQERGTSYSRLHSRLCNYI